MSWVNLHNHSEWSILDGTGEPEQRAEVVKKLGQNSLSLSDHGNLCGIPSHIEGCNKHGLKPIVGIEAYFKPDASIKDVKHKENYHLLLLAKNENGFKNLIKLSSWSHTEGFYHKPCVDWASLKKYSKDIICSTACLGGYVPQLIQEHDEKNTREAIERYADIFGDDFYLEIMPHDIPAQSLVNQKLAQYSDEFGIPLLATADSHYLTEEWLDTRKAVFLIRIGETMNSYAKKRETDDIYDLDLPLHLFSEDEMYEMFRRNHRNLTHRQVAEACGNTQKLADSIEPFELDTSPKMPKIAKDEGDALLTLQDWCAEGLKRIGKSSDPEYVGRLNTELEVIHDLDVASYFVIVGKIVRWARDNGSILSASF